MKGKKPDSKINGRGIRRGCEAAMVKLENLYFHEFDNEAANLGVRRIQRVADSRPSMRSNIFIQPELISRLDPFRRVYNEVCRPLLPCPSESPGAFLSEETLSCQAEAAASIWKMEPRSPSATERAKSLNNCGYLSYKGAIQHSSLVGAAQRTPVRTSSEQSGGTNSTPSGKKGSPSSSLKALSHRLKDILKSAMTDSDLRYIKGDELMLGGGALDEVEVCTPKHQDSKNQHTVTKDSVESPPDPVTHGMGFKEQPQTTSGTDASGEDGFIDAVSLSASSEDGIDGDHTTKNNGSGIAESGNIGGIASPDRQRAASSVAAPAQIASLAQIDGAGTSQRLAGDARSPTASPSMALYGRTPNSFMRFQLLRDTMRRPSDDTPEGSDMSLASPEAQTWVPKVPNDRRLDTQPPAKSASQMEVTKRPRVPVPSRDAVSDPSESRRTDVLAHRPNDNRGSAIINTGSDVLEMRSAHLINNVVEVRPSGQGGILQHLRKLSHSRDSTTGAALENAVPTEEEPRITGKLVDKKHSIELRRNGLYREFIDSYNEKRKTKFLKGIRIPLKKNDTQTTLLFADLPNTGGRNPGCGNTPPHSAPSDRLPALSTDDESPPLHRSYYAHQGSSSSAYERDHGVREYHDVYPPDDGYRHGPSLERYEDPRDYGLPRPNRWSSETMYETHMHHNEVDWYHHRPVSRQGSVSSITASDGNTVDPMYSSHTYRDRSFERIDDYESRSGCTRRSYRPSEYMRDDGRYHHRSAEMIMSAPHPSYPSEYRESYVGYRESDRYALEHDRRDYYQTDYRQREREYDYAYRPRHRAYETDAPRHYGRR
ncbi:hypothetical protein, conserved [Babesia ovata]|uniref:Uncharacterized protein n=1 Tax=Babesia ovata TaxID=189622 RepID=A0A2H6K7H2_9APIC|nr:uncharacterized protein BOVATA_004270 [Babesia ovata]GBE58934.1 hypothetical protein, conserved [Babesia ovata]